MNPDVSGEWTQGRGALGHQGRGRREPIPTGHILLFADAPLSTQGSNTRGPAAALHSPERARRRDQSR